MSRLFLIILAGLSVWSQGCASGPSVVTEYRSTSFSDGIAVSMGPPVAVGRGTREAQFLLQGGIEQTASFEAMDGQSRVDGASGNHLPTFQLRGMAAYGVTDRWMFGVSGRFSDRRWPREEGASDSSPDFEGAVLGAGILSRFVLKRFERGSLELSAEVEYLELPLRTVVLGTATTFVDGRNIGTSDISFVDDYTREELMGRVDLLFVHDFDAVSWLVGVGAGLYSSVEVGFESEMSTSPPEPEPVVSGYLVSLHSGLEVPLGGPLSVVAVAHVTGSPSFQLQGLSSVGVTGYVRILFDHPHRDAYIHGLPVPD